MAIVRIARRSSLADQLLGAAKRNKYNATATYIDGHRFASYKEAARYCTLKIMQQQKHIHGLTLQPRYKLNVNGIDCGTYIADFRYTLPSGAVIVEDVKSEATRTRVYVLKRKLVAALYGVVIEEM